MSEDLRFILFTLLEAAVASSIASFLMAWLGHDEDSPPLTPLIVTTAFMVFAPVSITLVILAFVYISTVGV